MFNFSFDFFISGDDHPKFYLKPLYEKFMLGIIGRDNIAWPQGKAVEVSQRICKLILK